MTITNNPGSDVEVSVDLITVVVDGIEMRVPKGTLAIRAAEMLGVSEQTLRRWDKAGKLKPARHPMNGYRLYSRKVVQDLRRLIHAQPTGGTR